MRDWLTVCSIDSEFSPHQHPFYIIYIFLRLYFVYSYSLDRKDFDTINEHQMRILSLKDVSAKLL